MRTSWVSGGIGGVGVFLIALAVFLMTDDLRVVVFVVGVVALLMSALIELVERGYWK